MSQLRNSPVSWRLAGGAAAAVTLAGCIVDTSSSRQLVPGVVATPGAGPLLVDVDPNRTLIANPGAGVGVFTEYQTGGHWHVWWTCDTSVTGLPCGFVIVVSVSSGAISNLAGQLLEVDDTLVQPGPALVQATARTTTGVDGITFDTTPGVAITLDAQVNGLKDGSLLFFVQNGVPNGNYQGPLTDPLMLEPVSP